MDVQGLLDHAEGLVCLSGCASRSALLRHGRRDGGPGALDEPLARRLLEGFGPEGLYVELQRPFARHDRARNRALAALARRLAVRCVATGNVHAHARCRAELQDAFVALRNHATLDACEPLRRGNHSHVMSSPQAMASASPTIPRRSARRSLLAEQLTFDLRRDLGYRYPGAEQQSASRRLAELCRQRLRERYGDGAPAGRPGAARGGPRAPGAGAGRDRPPRPGRLLPAPPRHAGARARGGPGGPRAGLGARAAGAGPRARLLGLLAGLLPDGPLAHRPGRSAGSRWGASCTRTCTGCRTSTSTSRATSASG